MRGKGRGDGKGIDMTIDEGAQIIVESWLNVKRQDIYHYITDETKLREAEAFVRAAENRGAVTKVTVLDSKCVQSAETVEAMRESMSFATVIIGATNYSFVTTDAVDYALKQGARFLSLPLSTNDGSSLLENDFLRMDPKRALRIGRPVMKTLNAADTIHVRTQRGTDVTFSKKGRKAGIFTGRAARAGAFASASFETYVPIVENATNGCVVLDGSLGYLGLVKEPIELHFRDGYLVSIAETAEGKRLNDYMASFDDPEMYCAAEFGIGLNECAQCRGVAYIEDESTMGTFHIGFGRNVALGGQHSAAGHFDIVMHKPSIEADGVVLMREGKWTHAI